MVDWLRSIITVPFTISLVIFLVLHILLYFFSRNAIQSIFGVFIRITKSNTASYYLIAILFIPGTIVHEFAHFLTATILQLKVKEVSIIPTIQDKTLKLGHVIYGREDVFRGTIVGVAPLFGTWALYAFIAQYINFIQRYPVAIIALGYLLFCSSATMFSSKQDLVDAAVTIPILLLFFAITSLAHLNFVSLLHITSIPQFIQNFVTTVNTFLILALAIHIVFRVALQVIGSFTHHS